MSQQGPPAPDAAQGTPSPQNADVGEVSCHIEGESKDAIFFIQVTVTQKIGHLKDAIFAKGFNRVGFLAKDLTLFKAGNTLKRYPSECTEEFLKKLEPGGDEAVFKKMNTWETVLSYWSSQPNSNKINVFVKPPASGGKDVADTKKRRSESLIVDNKRVKRSESEGSNSGDPIRRKSDSDYDWLKQLHSKIWAREDRRPELFHEAEVTLEKYFELKKRYSEHHLNPKYKPGKHNVQSIKLELLKSCQPIPAPSERASSNQQINSDNDIDKDDTELTSFFPAILHYLDLSSLELYGVSTRIPLPLLIRHEYNIITERIDDRPDDASGSVIVSGQPGTGKTAFLHLMVINFMISGREFLYQGFTGDVFHVSETVKSITSWSSRNRTIVAFFDSDKNSSTPQRFICKTGVKIIAASSPRGAEKEWLKQLPPDASVISLGADLWSPQELFLTGIFLNSKEITYMKLREVVSYFGFNPRHCFEACQSEDNFKQLKENVRTKIKDFATSGQTVNSLMASTKKLSGINHSIFELSMAHDERRLFVKAQIEVVSRWALDELLKKCAVQQRDAAIDFYMSIANEPYAGSVRGHMFENKVLQYFDECKSKDFPIRSLTDSKHSTWRYSGVTNRIPFDSRSFTPSLTEATRNKTPSHLVPSMLNFTAVDSVIYDPNDPTGSFTCIQVTVAQKHPIAVQGLQVIQSWLKQGTTLADLRPSKKKPWRFIFVVPENMKDTFGLQQFKGDTDKNEWAGKVCQYVLGLKEDLVFGRI